MASHTLPSMPKYTMMDEMGHDMLKVRWQRKVETTILNILQVDHDVLTSRT